MKKPKGKFKKAGDFNLTLQKGGTLTWTRPVQTGWKPTGETSTPQSSQPDAELERMIEKRRDGRTGRDQANAEAALQRAADLRKAEEIRETNRAAYGVSITVASPPAA